MNDARKGLNDVAVVALVLFGISYLYINGCGSRRDTLESSSYITSSGDTTGAWVNMTYFVRDRLKCPSSAKFEYAGARNVIPLDNNRYRIESYVNAQNSFGAPIRIHFEGVVRKRASTWELEEVNTDE